MSPGLYECVGRDWLCPRLFISTDGQMFWINEIGKQHGIAQTPQWDVLGSCILFPVAGCVL